MPSAGQQGRRPSSRPFDRTDFTIEALAERFASLGNIVLRLQADPDIRTVPNVGNATHRHTDGLSQGQVK
jgi:hypothetical protein